MKQKWQTAQAGVRHSHRLEDLSCTKRFPQNVKHGDICDGDLQPEETVDLCGGDAEKQLASLGKHTGTAQHSEEGQQNTL